MAMPPAARRTSRQLAGAGSSTPSSSDRQPLMATVTPEASSSSYENHDGDDIEAGRGSKPLSLSGHSQPGGGGRTTKRNRPYNRRRSLSMRSDSSRNRGGSRRRSLSFESLPEAALPRRASAKNLNGSYAERKRLASTTSLDVSVFSHSEDEEEDDDDHYDSDEAERDFLLDSSGDYHARHHQQLHKQRRSFCDWLRADETQLQFQKWLVLCALTGCSVGSLICVYWLLDTKHPHNLLIALLASVSHVPVAMAFRAYDKLMQRQLASLTKTATRSRELVSSLYPANVLDRLLSGDTEVELEEEEDEDGERESVPASELAIELPSMINKKREESLSLSLSREDSETNHGGAMNGASPKNDPLLDPVSGSSDDVGAATNKSNGHVTAAPAPTVRGPALSSTVDNKNGPTPAATSGSEKDKTDDKAKERRNGDIRDQLAQSDSADIESFKASPPIADFFPSTTILFADIAGFTAWSSTREPAAVFTLLEHIFHAFDTSAKKRGVFKVETVGDCYVAVTGLPEPRKDHAQVMAKFACDCMRKMDIITQKLGRTTLGPDTYDLTMRIGIHSGSVTAGVLRGEKSRFQLFGDTMNTASRVETTGEGGRIHLSQDTANLLNLAGKGHWMKQRKDKVFAKGKGNIQTYWLKIGRRHHKHKKAQKRSSSIVTATSLMSQNNSDYYTDVTDADFSETASESSEEEDEFNDEDDLIESLLSPKTAGLIYWNVRVLARLLKRIVAFNKQNGAQPVTGRAAPPSGQHFASSSKRKKPSLIMEPKDTLDFPEFDQSKPISMLSDQAVNAVNLDARVIDQLKDYVTNIAISYGEDAFHNFEHASHSAMQIDKYVARMLVAGRQKTAVSLLMGLGAEDKDDPAAATQLYNRSFGLAFDPLAQFACAFATLIRDAGYKEAGTASSLTLRLAREGPEKRPRGQKSPERSSLSLALDLLMDKSYKELRAAISPSDFEFERFRQLAINLVFAMDVADKDLFSDPRWEGAFPQASPSSPDSSNPLTRDQVNRKASLVLEHMVQASDVAHTMQHWQVYRKFDDSLFRSAFGDFKAGRIDKNPADFWYYGSLALFDSYVIPLAKRLNGSGVLGVVGEESLGYALKNRDEWMANGRNVVSEMAQKFGIKPRRPPSWPPLPSPPSSVRTAETSTESDSDEQRGRLAMNKTASCDAITPVNSRAGHRPQQAAAPDMGSTLQDLTRKAQIAQAEEQSILRNS